MLAIKQSFRLLNNSVNLKEKTLMTSYRFMHYPTPTMTMMTMTKTLTSMIMMRMMMTRTMLVTKTRTKRMKRCSKLMTIMIRRTRMSMAARIWMMTMMMSLVEES